MASKIVLSYGLAVAGSLRQMLRITEQTTVKVIGCYEEFSAGPLLPLSDMDRFVRARVGYWRKCHQPTTSAGWLAEMRRHVRNIGDREVEIWVGHNVQEQVFLVTILALARESGIDDNRISIVQFPLKAHRETLDSIRPEMLEEHPPAVLLSKEISAIYTNIWGALSSSEPSKLTGLIEKGTTFPAIDSMLKCLFMRYPDKMPGIGSISRKILEEAKPGWDKSARIVGMAMAPAEYLEVHLDFTGDGILFDNLLALGSPKSPQPTLELRGDTRKMRSCEARITPFGEACLRGECNNILINGIDEWVAGVHLNSQAGQVWFRDGNQLVHFE